MPSIQAPAYSLMHLRVILLQSKADKPFTHVQHTSTHNTLSAASNLRMQILAVCMPNG